ncbi:MAG TPA: amidase [Candidatus Tectomicrobia bacterium]|nr:amidase [Candidatus Tectomicrobia bacterium]
MDAIDLCYLPATELEVAIRTKQVSPVDVVDAMLARIERLNPRLNAYCTVTATAARAAAKEAEAAVMRGDALGTLHGIPVSIKDLIATQGIRTTHGSKLYEQFIPDEDAPVVERLKRAGAIILGKTNTPEFGHKAITNNLVFGLSRNPWSLEHTPGGSSGGAAAAVAAGLGPLAVGTDGGGSIRIPSSCCGIFGLKPTLGLVAAAPTFGGLETLSHTGPMTRTVRDAALMLNAMVGADPRDLSSLPVAGIDHLASLDRGIHGLRVAWSPDLGYAAVDPQVRQLAEGAAGRFTELGCHVEGAHPDFADPAESYQILSTASRAARIADRWPAERERFDPSLAVQIEAGMRWSAIDFVNAANVRRTLNEAFVRFFRRYDLLLTPTLTAPPPPVTVETHAEIAGQKVRRLGWLAFTFPLNLIGYPAASIPCGWTREGLPVGLQIVAPRFAEVLVLRAAAAFEAIAPWAHRRPSLD